MRSALSIHADRDSVAVLDAGEFDTPSTKQAAQALGKWGSALPALIVLEASEEGAARSFRNIQRVRVADAGAIGVADVVGAASIVISQQALEQLQGRLA
jgi:large subunit ribosomal protein L4